MTPLTPRTAALVERLFDKDSIAAVKSLLEEECGQNLPLCENLTPESLERIRFAALKVSTGNIDQLLEAVSLAQLDWRDLLMWAGFGASLIAHEEWAEKILNSPLTN